MTQIENVPRETPQSEPALVSVLIPCFNAEAFLQQAIESALQQTYPHKQVIVVDDGSTDASARIAESFGSSIRFERSVHRGACAIRNRLLELAEGTWLQYLDADDYLLPNKIAGQLEFALGQDPVPDVVYSPITVHWESSNHSYQTSIDPAASPLVHFIRWEPFNTHGILLRREVVVRAGGWQVDQPCCQEHELLLRILMAGGRFAFYDRCEAVYRFHSDNTISRRDPARVIRERMRLLDLLEAHLRRAGGLPAAAERALAIARIEGARALFAWDPQLAGSLSQRARGGNLLLPASRATPLRYRLTAACLGFERAERVAGWVRGAR